MKSLCIRSVGIEVFWADLDDRDFKFTDDKLLSIYSGADKQTEGADFDWLIIKDLSLF